MKIAEIAADVMDQTSRPSAYWVEAEDGIRLRLGIWEAAKAKGTILLFPGRTEYIEKLCSTAVAFGKQGYSTLIVDWRGQGLSDRLTTNRLASHVEKFSDYQLDVRAILTAAEAMGLPKPWFLFAHSMGALIGLRALVDGLPVSACAFTGAMWGIPLPPAERPVAGLLTGAFRVFGAGHVFAPGNKAQQSRCYVESVPFEGNRLTRDAERFEYMLQQARDLRDHQTGAPTMAWVSEALKECSRLKACASPAKPCVTFIGEKDGVVDHGAIQDRMKRWPSGSLVEIEGARHDLLSETIDVRSRVIADSLALFARTCRQ